MFRRIVASCFIVLALSPFTAPFSTCDLSALRADPPRQRLRETTPVPLPGTVVTSSIPERDSEPPAAGRARFVVSQQSASFFFPSTAFGAVMSRRSNGAALHLAPPGGNSSLRI
jgi:hypothetical protein